MRALGAASTLATLFALRFHFDADDRLSKVTVVGLPIYSRARAERRKLKQRDAHELPDFGGRE